MDVFKGMGISDAAVVCILSSVPDNVRTVNMQSVDSSFKT